MSYLSSRAEKGITVATPTHRLIVYAADKYARERLSAEIIIDGTKYSVTPTKSALLYPEEGSHTLEAVIPADKEFNRWFTPSDTITIDNLWANPTGFTITGDGQIQLRMTSVIETALSISAPSTVAPDEVFTISGKLTRVDTGAGLSGMTVNISFNGTAVGSVTTGTGGDYSVDASISTEGSFTLTAEFPGAQGYSPQSAVQGLQVGAPRLGTAVKAAIISVPVVCAVVWKLFKG